MCHAAACLAEYLQPLSNDTEVIRSRLEPLYSEKEGDVCADFIDASSEELQGLYDAARMAASHINLTGQSDWSDPNSFPVFAESFMTLVTVIGNDPRIDRV